MEDTEIVALYFRRDQEALAESERKYGKRLLGLANRILDDREDSRECVNDALFSAWQTIPPKRPENLLGYLGSLTRSRAIDCRRRKQSEKRGGGQYALCLDELAECVGKDADPAEQINAQALTEAVARWLTAQPEERRRIFSLRYYHMVSLQDIAALLDCSETKIKSRLFRARKSLRRHLIKEGWSI